MQVKPQFTFEKIRFDQDNDTHLVLDILAPKAEFQGKRPPLCIITALDCSTSMNENNKLFYAKQSLLKLVDHLSSDDYLGLVSFATSTKEDAQPQRMTPERKERLRELIGNYRAHGNTNLSGGLISALHMAKNTDLPLSTLIRVIAFTDGQPNVGVTAPDELSRLLEKNVDRATVSTFGYGPDAVHDLLSVMADKGKGNYAYVKDPDSALTAFGKELGGLLSTYAQNITIGIQPHGGHSVTEVLSDAEVEEETDGLVRIKIPHLLSEETVNVVISTKMSKQKSAGPRAVNAFDVSVAYQAMDATGKMVDHVIESKAKIQFVREGEEQQKPTPSVDEIVARAQLVQAQIAAESAAKKGEFKTAGLALQGFQISAAARGHEKLAAVGSHVEGFYKNQQVYEGRAGRRRAMAKVVTRGMGMSASLDAEDQALISDAGYVVSNSSQIAYTASFAGTSATGNTADSGSASANAQPEKAVQPNPSYPHLTTWNGPTPGVLQPPASTTTHAPVSVSAGSSSRVKKSRSKRW